MIGPKFLAMSLAAGLLVAPAAVPQQSTALISQVTLKYLGTAGWEISDGNTVILVDPYVSRINGPPPPSGPGTRWQATHDMLMDGTILPSPT